MQEISTEIWKDIEGYDGRYQVSDLGRVRSQDWRVPSSEGRTRVIKGRILKPQPDKYGYMRVNLYADTHMKAHQVHRLVASAFIPNPCHHEQVNHRNEQKTDNRADNLEWCDVKYNITYGNRSRKVSETRINGAMLGKAVEQLTTDGQHVSTYRSINEASRATGADNSVIIRCCKGKTETAGGYRWRYAE